MGKIKKTFEQRHTFTLENPVMSWSMYNTFTSIYGDGKKQWYDTYVLGKKQSSPELTFGKAVADSMETATPLVPFTRLNIKKDGTHKEHEFDTKLGKIPLVGSIDTFEPPKKKKGKCRAGEFKSGKILWDKKRVEEHKQLDFYTLMLYLQDKIMPDQIDWFLEWAPTQKEESGDFNHKISFTTNPPTIHHFKTKRTMKQILKLAVDLKKVHKEMLTYYSLCDKL